MVCTFFGHKECPDAVKPRLRDVLVDLIINKGVDIFYSLVMHSPLLLWW